MTSPASRIDAPLETVAIVGVGLIGGSLAAALKQRNGCRQVVGVGRDEQRLEQARALGLIDTLTTSIADSARHASLIVFCTPVERIPAGVREAAAHCRPGTLLTDAGSVKGTICSELADLDGRTCTFIGSHPLAGSEKQGFEHADANLYQDRLCVVTPTSSTPADALARLRGFWQGVGMTVLEMPPDEHDRALAQTSHLPHVVAAALAAMLAPDNQPLAASGFRDTTRIAAGDPELWVGILLNNRAEILASLDGFSAQLAAFRQAIDRNDANRLRQLLAQAKSNRDTLSNESNRG